MTLIKTAEDKQWLLNTHLRNVPDVPAFEVAVLVGNDDYPRRIVLYPRDDFRAVPVTFAPDDDGIYHQVDNQETA